METDQRQDRKPEAALELRRCVRFQQAGWLMFCCWPVAAIVAAMCNLSTMAIGAMSVLMIMAAVIVFAIGHTGLQELKERENGNK